MEGMRVGFIDKEGERVGYRLESDRIGVKVGGNEGR